MFLKYSKTKIINSWGLIELLQPKLVKRTVNINSISSNY